MTTDDRPSIAELQSLIESKDRIDEFEVTCKRMQRAHSLIFRVCQQARVAPVLLEIAAAALAVQEQDRVAASARSEIRYVATDDGYAAVDAADRELLRRIQAFNAALAKVMP
jgi:hypothetical protein